MVVSFWKSGLFKGDGMSAFLAKYPGIVNEIRTKVSVLPCHADESGKIEVTGLWDTGAQYSVITQKLADLLGLQPVDIGRAYTANGWYETHVYRLDAILPNGVRVTGLKVSTGDLMVCDMLIGMDVIRHGDLLITNKDNTEFSFRIPSDGTSPNN